MATARVGPAEFAREHPLGVTACFSLAGYALVIGTLYVGLPIYPDIGLGTVNLLSHAIAVINTTTIGLLAIGWYWIRQGEVRKHRIAMLGAFGLIVLFLVLYLTKTGGGGRKDVVGTGLIQTAYLAMLGVHIVLSVLSVPLVVYQVVLGVSHAPSELYDTNHARVGRVAVVSWLVSLSLGVVAYVLLNFVLEYEFVEVVAVS